MQTLFTLLLFLISFSLFGQLDTMIVYDLETQTYEIILPVEFDASITNDKTSSYNGTMEGFTILSNEIPTENLFTDTEFTRLTKTADLFDLTHYPLRTSVNLKGVSKTGTNFNCSGTLISSNLVLTATHCTFDYFTNIEFYVESMEAFPSYDNGALPLGFPSAQVSKIFLTKKSFDGNGYFDVCMLLLDEPIGEMLGYQGIGFAPADELVEKVFHKMSYPASNTTVDPSGIYNGDTTYYNYGLMSYNVITGFLNLDAPTASGIPGQSGSGLFESIDQEQTIFGVLSFSNYQHILITPNYFYQMKNIIENYNILSPITEVEKTIHLQVQPNPFEDFTTVILPKDLKDIVKYKLIDLRGKIVQQGEFNTQDLTLSRDGLTSGIYILSIFLENGVVVSEQIVIR